MNDAPAHAVSLTPAAGGPSLHGVDQFLVDAVDACETLWVSAEGTRCVLTTHAGAPRYEISLMNGSDVVRSRRLYSRASAQMLADGWRWQRERAAVAAT